MTPGTGKPIAALRLYIPASSRARKTTFWHHFGAPALAHHLLTAAHDSGIEQALLQVIQTGYLPGARMTRHHPETDMRHPQCLEMVDEESRLRAFLEEHAEELHGVRAVLFLCELTLRPSEGES